jgi:hypothetical protein
VGGGVTLQDLGSIGEFVAAMATLATLGYLALQIRSNTRESQAASRNSVSQSFINLLAHVSLDAETSKIVRRGLFDPQSLDADDTFRFDLFIGALLTNIEDAFSQRRRNILTDEDWEKWMVLLKQYMAQPGVQASWSRTAESFNPAFRQYVEDLEPNEIYSYAFGDQPATPKAVEPDAT